MPFKLAISRPDTTGETFLDSFDSMDELEFFRDQIISRFIAIGWSPRDRQNAIELYSEDGADLVLIEWSDES